ncbi:hypothetical protein OHA84_18055 [Streptomyces sp. NBC_00513]|uniref:hypothetical protein n=1 Tax=unclassified Streptomyces TaxID=2593676 RepID=UPI00225A63DC|nr:MULTISPECIES: hypothetical protein [unclassified Streptomyces]MCX5074564.1 hypothetical protein [Streptomyces sp. NBC_00424]MCX5153907.1 hypothetical protein [Streptomyces sp. NBC_00291]WUD42259.1 hypothetical protein OHA84_18055 [Streptomyces sp. NBC_00513]
MSPQDQHGSRGYSVPTGRPYALKELQATLGSLGDHMRELYDGAHPAEYDGVADALYIAFQTASGLAPAKSYTGCPEHPNGALDPEAPDGWGRCLICNDRRRLGLRGQGGRTAGAAPAAGEQRRLGYPVPDPPYTHDALRAFLRTIEDRRFHLGLSSPPEEFVRMADDLHRAFIVARELSRPRNASGCSEHPGAPIDPDAPPGEACIFCAGRRRRAQRPAQTPEMLPRIRRGERRQLQRRFERPPG